MKGLAVRGYREDEEEWLEDVADSDYGLWLAREQRVETIVKKNTRISDTYLDKRNLDSGKSRDVHAINDRIPEVIVYQNSEKIGHFSLPYRGSGQYRIFFEVDKKHGWLTVYIYDRGTMQWYDDVLEHKIRIQY